MLHPGQEDFLESITRPVMDTYGAPFMGFKYAGLSSGNRWGKSHTLALLHIWLLVYKHGVALDDKWESAPYETLNCAPTKELADIVGDKILEILQGNEETAWMIVKVSRAPHFEITFFNGAVFRSLTTNNKGKGLLGRGYRLITFDECAFEPYFLHVVNQVLAQRAADYNASIVFSSTPDGPGPWSNFFRRNLDYCRYGDTRENVHLNFRGLLELLSKMPDLEFQQNVLGQFVSTAAAVFSELVVENAVDDALNAQPFPVIPGHKYAIGLDIANKKDKVVLIVLDVTKPDRFTFAYWWIVDGSSTTYDEIERRAREVHAHYNSFRGYLAGRGDSTGIGDAVMQKLSDIIDPYLLHSASKKQLISTLQAAMEFGRRFDNEGENTTKGWGLLRIPRAEELVASLLGYRWADKNLPTDPVIATALALSSVWTYDRNDTQRDIPTVPYSLPFAP